jgi:hypothetical protein
MISAGWSLSDQFVGYWILGNVVAVVPFFAWVQESQPLPLLLLARPFVALCNVTNVRAPHQIVVLMPPVSVETRIKMIYVHVGQARKKRVPLRVCATILKIAPQSFHRSRTIIGLS